MLDPMSSVLSPEGLTYGFKDRSTLLSEAIAGKDGKAPSPRPED
jgi:hypothetical protein